MGCGSSVAQVSDSVKEGLFRPIRMLDFEKEGDSDVQGKAYLLGETRTQRKIIQLDFLRDASQVLSCRVRIPVPRVHYDPVQLMYEESQEVFHLGIYGLSVVPPFNRMLALCLQDTLIFICGGKDFDNYNIKSDCFYYSLAETQRTDLRNKYAGNRFQKVSSMGTKRYGHAGVYLQKQKSLIVVGGINQKGEIVNSCERYAVMDNIWRDLPPMHVTRAFANCLQYGNKVYVFGGRSSPTKRSKKIEVFDSETHQWTILDFKLHRGIEDALVFSQKPNEILIIGGKTNFGPTRTVLRLDLLSQAYVWDSDLHYEYQSTKGVKTRQRIIIFGGSKEAIEEYKDGQWASKPFEMKKYAQLEDMQSFTCTAQSIQVTVSDKSDVLTQQKQDFVIFGNDDHPCILSTYFKGNTACLKKKSLSMKFKQRSKMSIVQYQIGKYFLAGGCDAKGKKSFNSAYFYNSTTHEFQETVKMAEKKHNFAICALQGFIYTFGGFENMDKLAKKTCSKFNIANESWDSLPTLRRARDNCVAVCIGNSKIAVFGGTKGEEQVAGIEIFYPSQRKFDIFEPDLHIPSTILCAYSDNSNNDRIIILNKASQNNEITNISLTHPSPSSNRSSLSQNRETIDLNSFVVNHSASSFKKSEPQQLPKKKEQHPDTNIIRIKPAMVQIHPKKLQSQSSQMQLENDFDDIDQSFEIERIDLKKNKFNKLKTSEVHEEVKQQASSNENELKIEVEQPIIVQSEIPKIDPVAQEPKRVEKKVQEPQEEVRTIWTQPLSWLPNADYSVVQRIEHTYFLTDDICVEFNKNTGEVREMKVENISGLSLSMIK